MPAELEVKWTVPVYPVAVALLASSAVTVTLKATPFVTLAGALTLRCVTGGALTVVFVLPVRPPSATLID